ncbi:WAP four-disulfide core domain protein 1 isoform X7 [Canis aureus]
MGHSQEVTEPSQGTHDAPPARGPLVSEHVGGNAFFQPQDGQRQKEGHLGSVLPAASPGSRFCQESLETGIAPQAGREAPLLDWLVQPKPRWLGGNGWLLDGPEEVLQAEACSTTEDGAEPLLCPSGYECHILSPGDVAEGIPNRGQCVKQRRQAELPIVGIFVVSPTFRLLFGVMSTFSHQTAWAPVATWLLTAAYVFIPKEKEGPGMLHRRQPGQTQPFASENSCGPHC